jgi:antitoxin YefM
MDRWRGTIPTHHGALDLYDFVYLCAECTIEVPSWTFDLRDVRANLKNVMDRVTGDREEVVARRKGGLVVSLETWSAVTGTLHLLTTPENAAALRRSIAELDASVARSAT